MWKILLIMSPTFHHRLAGYPKLQPLEYCPNVSRFRALPESSPPNSLPLPPSPLLTVPNVEYQHLVTEAAAVREERSKGRNDGIAAAFNMPGCDDTLLKGGDPLTTSLEAAGFEVGFTTSTLNLYVYFQHHSPKRT